MEPEIIEIYDEEGNAVACELIGMFTIEDSIDAPEYAALWVTEGEFQGETMFFKVEDDDEDPDMENFVSLEDPDEIETVYNVFVELFKEEFETEE